MTIKKIIFIISSLVLFKTNSQEIKLETDEFVEYMSALVPLGISYEKKEKIKKYITYL